MDADRGESVVAGAIQAWPSHLEDVLLGSSDPAEIVRMVDDFCRGALDGELRRVTFYRRGVGAVFGLLLSDNEHVVLKVHRRDLIGEGLEGIRAIQLRLADRTFPAPRPIGPSLPLGNGIGTAEEMLRVGEVADAHDESVRRVLAEGLFRFVDESTPMLPAVRLPFVRPLDLADESLWPTPHDLRFDFSLAGAGWIDELARDARSLLRRDRGGPMVVGHADWKIENLRVSRSALAAVFDWDSVCKGPEAVFVGANSTVFTCDWSDPSLDPYPSAAETSAFIADYETARGCTFTSEEREMVEAARVYRLAYGARCEHSDSMLGLFPGSSDEHQGWAGLLRSFT